MAAPANVEALQGKSGDQQSSETTRKVAGNGVQVGSVEGSVSRSHYFDYFFTFESPNVQLPDSESSATATVVTLPAPSIFPGPYLRLCPLELEKLPEHPLLSPLSLQMTSSNQRPSIRKFLFDILAEARYLAKQEIPQWKHVSTKTFEKTVDGKVDIFRHEVKHDRGRAPEEGNADPPLRDFNKFENGYFPENWFARQSIHPDAAQPKTASWSEFVNTLRDNHSENERAYTDTVYDARVLIDYAEELKNAGISQTISGLTMRVMEMAHETPALTSNRVFPELVITASLNADEFIVAQLPVDMHSWPGSFYVSGKNKKKENAGDINDQRQTKSVVVGRYASVEHLTRIEDTDGSGKKVKWIMATVSDAGGHIPKALQSIPMAGILAADVEFVIKWIRQQRSKTT